MEVSAHLVGKPFPGMNGFAIQLGGELRKMFARKRTYLGFGVFAALVFLMPLLFEMEGVKRLIVQLIEKRGHSAGEYFSGLTLALLAMRTTMLLVGVLFVALVAGDVVSKEAEDGTLRMLLARPVSRSRILAVKFSATSLYTCVLTVFIGLAALASGLAHTGRGGMLAIGPQEKIVAFYPFHEGLLRYLTTLPLLALSLHCVAAAAFMFSCGKAKPVTAAVTALSIFYFDFAVRSIPFFDPFEPYLLTTRISAWMQVFQPAIPWARIVEDYALLLALDATMLIVGWLMFQERDLKA